MQSAWTPSDDQLAYLILAAISLACFWFAARMLLRPKSPAGGNGARIAGAVLLGSVGLLSGAALLFLATFTLRLF